MYKLSVNEIEHFEILKNNIEVKDISGYGNIFINCSNIKPKKKLYFLYFEYLEKNLKEAIHISESYNNKTFICHVNLDNITLRNFSYSFCKFLNDKLTNNPIFDNKLQTANFYYKNKVTKYIFDIIYNIMDQDIRKKYNLIPIK